MQTVAVIGAGPAGLAAARYLKSEGFVPVVLEQGQSVGGQWSGDPQYSGVWPSLHINTSRLMTAFSDLRHEPNAPIYPSNQTMRAYLERYAEQFDLMSCIRLNSRVLHIDRDPLGAGWVAHFVQSRAAPREERFAKVVVATGRHNKPMIPAVPGLESFSGPGGVTHAFNYKHPERYRGQRVLVAGCSISAVEIASDLAGLGAAHVITAYRRQRYFHQKLIVGMPADHILINRYRALAEETFPYEITAPKLRDQIVHACGSPERFGARQPLEDIGEAGVTMSQTFLPLVAEGRIQTKPWLQAVDGRSVRFADDSVENVDAIIFGTGYDLNLPFLSDDLRRTLGIDSTHIDLYKHTFHPDLPGLAFLGIVELIGSNFPPLELQARWIAYVLSGARPAPSIEEMRAGVAACKALRNRSQQESMHHATLMFAREAGVEPDLQQWPELAALQSNRSYSRRVRSLPPMPTSMLRSAWTADRTVSNRMVTFDAQREQATRHPVLLYPDLPQDKATGPSEHRLFDQALFRDSAQIRLIILDGTWRKSRKMLYLNPLLQKLPRLPLANMPASQYAIRKAHSADQLSTLEATCYALMQIEGNEEKYQLEPCTVRP